MSKFVSETPCAVARESLRNDLLAPPGDVQNQQLIEANS
jgi:hypothetical protein